MQKIAISRIKVDAARRQREDVGDIESLATSMKEHGLFHPVLLDTDFNLVAGFRRLMAAIALGQDTIEFKDVGQLTELESQEIELEENIRRKQLDWKEEQKAIARLHRMKMDADPTWDADKTAEMINMSRRTVYNALELGDAIDTVPGIEKAETAHGAMLRLKQHKQIQDRKDKAAARALGEELGLRRRVQATSVCADALDYLKKLPEGSFDMVVSNPPYGVDIEGLFIGEHDIYSDEELEIVELCREVTKEVFRVLRPDKWFVWFYPTARIEEGKDMLKAAGFKFQARPAVWYKPNKFLSSLSNPYQTLSCQYETFFWARKGNAQFTKVRSGDVYVYDTPDNADRLHPLQMPVALWRDIIEQGSVTGEQVLEPFSGSGSAGVACIEMERNYLGIDSKQEFVDRANMWFSETIARGKEQPKVEIVDLTKDLEFTL